ncbi:DMT family transporter [Kineococcus sp. SYSU DK006]|uniref:DMT family transporter n=1 Tax=Kineococcus sp. SYSU DK006 TaxID=3383127 RepID=UPI003D7CD4F6
MGPALCLVSAACFGAMAVFGKLAYEAGVAPGALLLVRFGLAAVLLAALLLVRPALRHPPPPAPDRRTPAVVRARPGPAAVVTAVGLGAVGYATQASLYFAALELVDAALLSLIFYTHPSLVTVTAVLLGRDRLTPRRCAALVVASGGTLLVLLGSGGAGSSPLGALLAFGSALTYTAYVLVADVLVRRTAPVVLSVLVMAGAAAALAVRAAVTGGVDLGFGWRGWWWLVCIAVVSTVVAVLAFFAGLRRTGPSTAVILSTFEPVVTTASAALALQEFPGPVQLTGGLLVLSAVAVLQLRPAREGDRGHDLRWSRRRRGDESSAVHGSTR